MVANFGYCGIGYRQKTYLKMYLIVDFDASEKYNIIHKTIVFFLFNIFVKLLEKRKLIWNSNVEVS